MKFKTWKCFKDDNNTERTISRKINFFRLDSLLCWYPYKAQQHSGTGWWFQYFYLIRISLLSWNLQSLKSWFPLTTHLFFIQIKIPPLLRLPNTFSFLLLVFFVYSFVQSFLLFLFEILRKFLEDYYDRLKRERSIQIGVLYIYTAEIGSFRSTSVQHPEKKVQTKYQEMHFLFAFKYSWPRNAFKDFCLHFLQFVWFLFAF